MSKKVLVVEQSLAVRGVAESLLRQNGFEVVTADSSSQAREILNSSDISLVLLSSDMTDETGDPLYQSLGTDGATASIPLLVMHDQNIEEAPAYPPESVIGKPFTPREFLSAVGPYLGAGQNQHGDKESPFSGADFEEDIIDAALGLDKIEVDGAEVLEEDTAVYRKTKKKSTTESMIGFEFKVATDDTGKVVHKKFDSVTVPAEDAKLKKQQPEPKDKQKPKEDSGDIDIMEKKKPTPESLSESSKLEISTDQYGLIAEESAATDNEQLVDDTETHDYEWFLNELRKETDEGAGESVTDSNETPAESIEETELPPSIPAEQQVSLDSLTPQSESVPAEEKPQSSEKPDADEQPAASTEHGEAIEKFISEFKREVDKIAGDESDTIDVATVAAEEPAASSKSKSEGDLKWSEGVEKLPPDVIREISRGIVARVSQQVAEQLMARIDPDVIYHLIRDAVEGYLKKRDEEHSEQPS